jgi:hypothetical protein
LWWDRERAEEEGGGLTLEFVGIDRLQDFDLFELFFGGHGLRTYIVMGGRQWQWEEDSRLKCEDWRRA